MPVMTGPMANSVGSNSGRLWRVWQTHGYDPSQEDAPVSTDQEVFVSVSPVCFAQQLCCGEFQANRGTQCHRESSV